MDRMSGTIKQPQPLLKRLLRQSWWRSLRATWTQRALLLTALGGLLIAGITTALPGGAGGTHLAGYLKSNPMPSAGSRAGDTFNKAGSGDCLMWPEKQPDKAGIVNCANDHRFEVAEAVDMRAFPGSEYGPDAAPPSKGRIQQISQEQCQVAVRRYLGTRFDPNSKFTTSLLWSGDKAWEQSGVRRMLCGLQLSGAGGQQVAFKGKIADLDQSKVWPAGTCLGIEPSTNQPTDIPVDCAAPHAMEVTGSVNLAEKFPDAVPAEPDQDGFIKDSCTKMTDAYLAPVALRTTTLTLIYSTISLPTWTAGSHQVACSIGATLGNGAWATLVGSAKGRLLINGQPPVAPPDIPDQRMIMPPIPFDIPQSTSQTQVTSSQPDTSSTTGTQTQHLPNAPGPQLPASQTPPTAQPQPGNTGNTFLGTPPDDASAPGLGAPPPGGGPPPPGGGPPPPGGGPPPPGLGAPPPPAGGPSPGPEQTPALPGPPAEPAPPAPGA
jgi:predicted heme/steroid binding protein